MVDQPLGPILQIVKNEAIVRPHKSFVAKGATVVTTENKVIGKLDYPIGQVDHPYQVIKLNKNIPDNLLGQFAIAKITDKKQRKKKPNRNKRKTN